MLIVNIGSSKQFNFEGVKVNLKSVLGYIKNNPFGGGNLFWRTKAVTPKAKFPPAESPTIKTFSGYILLQYFWISVIINS